MTSATETRRVALITGGSGGIGAEIATRLASDGLSVAIQYAGNATAADRVAKAVRAQGGQAITVQGDVADAEEMSRYSMKSRTPSAESTWPSTRPGS